mgnify:CR=1 FL=1|tara:strand:+ start:1946 stop:2548 length:603 start_codon:yes stop_codon:yes gene_type:complete
MTSKKERTFVAVKPDGIQRNLIGEIIKRFENRGLKLVGIKMVVPTDEQIEAHYLVNPDFKTIVGAKTIESYKKKGENPPTEDPETQGQFVLDTLKKYMASGPIVAMCWEGVHAVEIVRKVVGGTEPRSSDVGTIRGDYVIDSYQLADTDQRAVRNLIHASGDKGEAEKEIELWFSKSELIDYRLVQEQMLYDVNLDGILE